MKCPICKKEFPVDFGDVYEGLNDFLVKAGAGDAKVAIVGKNLICPHCEHPLWVPIRGHPTLAIVLIRDRNLQNLNSI